MSSVIWNPLLFFWLTRKQKQSRSTGLTSEVLTSLASRMHSLRSISNGISANEARYFQLKIIKKSFFILMNIFLGFKDCTSEGSRNFLDGKKSSRLTWISINYEKN